MIDIKENTTFNSNRLHFIAETGLNYLIFEDEVVGYDGDSMADYSNICHWVKKHSGKDVCICVIDRDDAVHFGL